jgi:predicted transcriptional regulator
MEGKAMTDATFTFRVDDALKAAFARAAKSRDRTAAQILRDYMRDFVRQEQAAADHDAWFRREVQAGIDAADAGEMISAEEVEAEAAAWRAEVRRIFAGPE